MIRWPGTVTLEAGMHHARVSTPLSAAKGAHGKVNQKIAHRWGRAKATKELSRYLYSLGRAAAAVSAAAVALVRSAPDDVAANMRLDATYVAGLSPPSSSSRAARELVFFVARLLLLRAGDRPCAGGAGAACRSDQDCAAGYVCRNVSTTPEFENLVCVAVDAANAGGLQEASSDAMPANDADASTPESGPPDRSGDGGTVVLASLYASYMHSVRSTSPLACGAGERADTGELGVHVTNNIALAPVMAFPPGGSKLSVSEYQTCAVVNGGALCSGSNDHGRLGNDSTVDALTPVAPLGLTSGVTAIVPAWGRTCAIANGALWCWGYNDGGQIGNNTTGTLQVPQAVTGLTSGVTAVAGSNLHACAIAQLGQAWCWGVDPDGQLGNGDYGASPVPVAVTGLSSGVTAITTGWGHSCAIVNGGAKCWGLNGNGQLGNDSIVPVPDPVAVQGLGSGVTAITGGERHTCAIVNGGAYCWGKNDKGQLGTATTDDAHVPVAVPGLASGVTSISAAYNHTCVVKNGRAFCWGNNAQAQLGDNTKTERHSPVEVAFP